MSVQELMGLIDKNSSSIPEGDYLKMCSLMKTIHGSENTLHVIPDSTEREIVIDRNCIDKCYQWIMTMSMFDQINREFDRNQKRTAITPALKLDALREVAAAHGEYLEDYTIAELRAKVFEIATEDEHTIYENYLKKEMEETERLREDLRVTAELVASTYRDFSQSVGYEDLTWLMHWGTIAKRLYRAARMDLV
jgi:translation elongation factor EF-G